MNDRLDMLDRLLTSEDVSEYLRVSPHTIEMWRRKKVGPPWLKIGRSIRYKFSEVHAWLERRGQETTE